jgi:predicted ATPase
MRLAVSGTHCSGKSTLIESFLLRHRDYAHEQEAYEALELFTSEPSAEEFFSQLEYHITRLRKYEKSDRVIFERSPADYVAYLKAIIELRRHSADRQLLERAIELA